MAPRQSSNPRASTLLICLKLDPIDPDCPELVSALGQALVDGCLDVYGPDEEGGPDVAVRAIVLAVHDRLATEIGSPAGAWGAMHMAMREVWTALQLDAEGDRGASGCRES